MFNFKIKTMQKLFLFLTLAVSCITSYAQTNVHKNAREFRKMTEISSVVTLNNSQKSSINDALSRKEDKMERFNGKPLTKEMVFRKYEIDKECHEKLVSQLSDKQIADYCNLMFAPEVSAKTDYRMALLKEVDNDYTEDELSSVRESIYKYLMLEKIVYFKYKYDYAKQKENISRLKAIQPAALKASINNEKQKGYGRVVSGRVNWHKTNNNNWRSKK